MAQLFSFEKTKLSSATERNLFPVVAANKLLLSDQYKKLLNDIEQQVVLPKKHYRALYKPLLDNFAEFVQILPVAKRGHFGGLLTEGLQRALYILEMLQKEKPQPDTVLIYGLFSVALLYDIAKVNEDRTIIISEKNGAFIKKWLPQTGSMLDDAKYYRIRYGSSMPAWLNKRMTIISACKLMPEVGFRWLADNPKVLAIWLALLSGDQKTGEESEAILKRAYELLHGFTKGKDLVMPVAMEAITPEETALGEDFAEWLKKSLETGSISVNQEDSKVHMVKAGLFLEAPAIFQEFCSYKSLTEDWHVVFKQFNMLGFVPLSGEDYKFKQYFAKSPEEKQKQDRSLFKPPFKKKKETAEKSKVSLFGNKFADEQKIAVTGTFEGSTHIKNGVLLTPDATAWLTENNILDIDNTLHATEEEEDELDYGLIGLLKLLIG